MIEAYGDLWNYPCNVICVTTNNVIKQNGEAVMGSGVAWDAKQRYPAIARALAAHLQQEGNVPAILYMTSTPWIVSFPTKDHWREPAKMDLIVQSAHALVAMADDRPDWERIALPRPGCGNGRLRWWDVKRMLEPILDDRFHVVTMRA